MPELTKKMEPSAELKEMEESTFRKTHDVQGDGNVRFRENAIKVEEELSDNSPVKEEMEYEFFAPTNSGYEYDPLAIDNADADPIFYQPPVKTVKVEEPTHVALVVRMEPHISLATQRADEPVHFPTKRPKGNEALQTCCTVDPWSSPVSAVNDEDVILCSSDEEEPEIQAFVPIDAPLCENLLKSTPGFPSFYTDPLAVTPAGVKTESETSNACDPTGYFWTSEEQPNREIPFTGKPGLQSLGSSLNTPYGYFKLVLDDEFCRIFMDQANECASKMAEGNRRLSKEKNIKTLITRWKPICMKEFQTWLAILIQMGGIQCPSFNHYWSTEVLHQSSFFTKVSPLMSKDRWIGIMQALHFQKAPVGSKSVKPFFKINPLIKWFNRRMKMVYEPGRELCLEGPMVLWQGGLIPWSCLRDKKRGIKLHSVTEPGGLTLRLSSDKMDVSDESTSCKVVKTLLVDFEGKGHSVFMENCYNSVDLCHELLSRQLHTSGPLLSLRKNIPEQIVDSKPEPGHVVYTRSNHGIAVMKWRDDNDQVLFISSEFSPCLVETSYKSDKKPKPEAIAVFNKYLSGFDKRFRDLSEYGAVQKHTNNHVKISVLIIQMAVYNAFVLYKKYCTNNLDFAGFQTELVRKLCIFKKEFSPRTPPVEVVPPSNPDVWHRIEKTEHFDCGKPRKGRSLLSCKQCLRKNKKTKVTTYCVVCPEHPGLCLGDCFVQWHLHLGFRNVKEGTKIEDHRQKEER